MEFLARAMRAAWAWSGKRQDHIAEEIGVARITVVKWLTGKNTPRLVSLERFAAACGVSVESIMRMAERGFERQ